MALTVLSLNLGASAEVSKTERRAHFSTLLHVIGNFPGDSVVKDPPANTGGSGSIPGSGRSPGEGNGNSLRYSCLENPVDREAWCATVHGVTKSWTELSD